MVKQESETVYVPTVKGAATAECVLTVFEQAYSAGLDPVDLVSAVAEIFRDPDLARATAVFAGGVWDGQTMLRLSPPLTPW